MDTGPFEAAYVRVVRQMAELASKAAQTAVTVSRLDASFTGVGDASNTAAAGLGRADRALAGAGVAASKASVSLARTADVTTELGLAQSRETQATLRATAARGRYTELTAKQGMSTRQLASAQASLIAAEDRQVLAQERVNTASSLSARTSDRMRGAWSAIPGPVKVGAAALLAAGVAAVKMAADYQTAVTRIHTQAGTSVADTAAMSRGFLAMAASVGTLPKELADAGFHISSANQGILSTAKQLQVLKLAAEGAKLGGADLVDVTNALDAAVVSGIPGVKSFSQAMGALNATVGSGDMTMQNLAEALGTGVLAVIKGYGVNLRQASAALAVFGDNNIRGAMAGTQLRMAVQSLTVPSKNATDALAKLGLTGKDAFTHFAEDLQRGGLTLALTDLHDRLVRSGVDIKGWGEILTQAFTKRAGAGINILLQQFDRYNSKLADVTRQSNSFAADWQSYTHTFSFVWDQIKAGADAAAISIGQKLLPAATSIMRWIGSTGIRDVEQFWHAFTTNPMVIGAFRDLRAAVVDLASAFGDALHFVAPFVKVIGTVAVGAVLVAFRGLAAAAHAVGAVISDITGFFANNKAAAAALAAVVGMTLIPTLLRLASTVGAAAFTGLYNGIMRAGVGAVGLVRNLSSISPVTIAVGAAVGGLAILFERQAAASAKAGQAADDFLKRLHANVNNLSSVQASIAAITAQIRSVGGDIFTGGLGIKNVQDLIHWVNQLGKSGASMRPLTNEVYKLVNSPGGLNDLETVQRRLIPTEQLLEHQFGLTQRQVEALAAANNIDLTGSLKNVIPAFAGLVAAAKLSHSPTAEAAAALSDLGSKANTTSQDISDLDTAWNNLVGNFVDARVAEAQARDDLIQLDAALRKSHGSLSLNTSAGRQATIQLGSFIHAVQNVGDAVFKSSGSYDKARSAMQAMVNRMTHDMPHGSAVARQVMAQVNAAMSQIAGKSPTYGRQTGSGYSQGLSGTRGQATSAARAIQSAARSGLSGGQGAARQQGANFGQGFAAGIMGTIGGAIAAATQLVGAAIAAVKARAKSHSPSLVMMQEGEWFAGGFTLGIGNGTPAAARAAERMARAAVEAAQRARRTVMAGIRGAVAPDVTDPHQLARMLHGDIHGAVHTQTRANEAQQANAEAQAHAAALDKVAKRLADEAANARAASAAIHGSTAAEKAAKLAAENRASSLEKVAKASQREATAADNMATRTKNSYDRLAQAAQNAAQKAQDAATKLVGSVQSAVDAMTQTITGFEQSMASGVAGDTSLSSIWQSLTGTDANGDPITANLGALQGSLDGILVQAQSFSQDLNQIVAEGGGQDLITQLAGMGQQAGDALAQQLLAAGPGAIAALQKTMASIQSVATAEGNVLAKDFYGQGASALQQLIRGLESQFPALQAALAPIIAEINAVFGAAGVAQKAIPTPAKPAVIAAHAMVAPAHVPGFAAGVRNFAGGLAWVGEHGRELVTLPRGASVTPHGSDGASLVDMTAVLAELRELRAEIATHPRRTGQEVGAVTVAVIDRHARTNADTLRRHTRKR